MKKIAMIMFGYVSSDDDDDDNSTNYYNSIYIKIIISTVNVNYLVQQIVYSKQ
jgi:hypothetical protein